MPNAAVTPRQLPLAALLITCSLACGPSAAQAPAGAESGQDTVSAPTPGPAASVQATPAPAQGAADGSQPASPTPTETVATEGLLNGSFEWICDGTTNPPKYGAYWKGAFVYEPGNPSDLIIDGQATSGPDLGAGAAAEGRRFLRITASGAPVKQKITTDPRWSERTHITLSVRSLGGARLKVILEDGPGMRVSMTLSPSPGAGWQTHELPLGELFFAEHGRRPTPRLNLWLTFLPGEGGIQTGGDTTAAIDVDQVSATITMPLVSTATLTNEIIEHARMVLHRWFDAEDAGGLGLVDPETGYNLYRAFDVETGESRVPSQQVGYHSIHTLLLTWLEIAHEQEWPDEIATWTPALETFVGTMVERHFDPQTGLPQQVDLATGQPASDSQITVGAYVELLTRAVPLLADQELATAATARVRGTADTLLRLASEHDLPDTVLNDAKLNRKTGVFEGTYPNWYGHMPNRLTPRGELDVPRQFNTAWAIVTQRTFWYHLFKSPAAVMWAHSLHPRVQDLHGVTRAMEKYHRDWDASRYDLENDTDDHYGYLMEDLLDVYRHGGTTVPRSLELITTATSHRVHPTAADPGETLWIQAIRLGTACAGDSPRAIKGLHDLYSLPRDSGAPGAQLPLYRDVIQELAGNDYKSRQLTNSQFTESFFRHWEMVCICFKGKYQGDCNERPLDQWDGDVGDIFGGPPMQGIEAQVWAYSVATPAERAVIRSRLGTLRYVTDSTLARPYGYLFGMPKEIATQYQLPPKYITGLSRRSTIGLGYLLSWLHLLPHLLEEK
ncbi:MAG: hypothetical protein ACI9EF_000521 [Pseudohongiellaceae bacterium]|jgi:hypothetical protein